MTPFSTLREFRPQGLVPFWRFFTIMAKFPSYGISRLFASEVLGLECLYGAWRVELLVALVAARAKEWGGELLEMLRGRSILGVSRSSAQPDGIGLNVQSLPLPGRNFFRNGFGTSNMSSLF